MVAISANVRGHTMHAVSLLFLNERFVKGNIAI